MDWLIGVLQRLTCKWNGHDWKFGASLGENAQGYLWLEEECFRCRARRQRKV